VRRLAAAAGVCLLLAHAGAFADPWKSDWQIEQEERNWKEVPVKIPPYPKVQNLVEFTVSRETDFRFYIDATSLSVGSDGVVRYVLVARSPNGAENVSYEGIRCKDRIYRIYATGRRDGTWTEARVVRWRDVDFGSMNWHRALERDYFCPRGQLIQSAAEGVDALKRGRHPDAGVQ
jgi:hypothetical protein